MENNTNEAIQSQENDSSEIIEEPKKRFVVVPGEVIVTGDDILPGDGTRRLGENVLATRFGLAEQVGRVVKVISTFGAFIPRKNNVVIGRVVDITHNGWIVDIDYASTAYLSIEDWPRFINKHELDQHLAIGDVVSGKIWSVKSRGIDLSLKGKGLGRLEGGFIFRVIPSRVPRIIGREGSMINLIKDNTGCSITVGQNGWVWVRGPDTDSEIKARKAVEFVSQKVHVSGLTDKMEAWFKDYK